MTGGGLMRIAFDGKSGHAYTSIGRLAVERGHLSAAAADKSGLATWLRQNPRDGRNLMHQNRSCIFFRHTPQITSEEGPIGAAGVPLTGGRSLAVDRTLMTFHTPVWIDAAGVRDPDAPPAANATRFRRLMIAQDTGSAIFGPARGDLFFRFRRRSWRTGRARATSCRNDDSVAELRFPAEALTPWRAAN